MEINLSTHQSWGYQYNFLFTILAMIMGLTLSTALLWRWYSELNACRLSHHIELKNTEQLLQRLKQSTQVQQTVATSSHLMQRTTVTTNAIETLITIVQLLPTVLTPATTLDSLELNQQGVTLSGAAYSLSRLYQTMLTISSSNQSYQIKLPRLEKHEQRYEYELTIKITPQCRPHGM